LADAWNVAPQEFPSRRAAQQAAWFYQYRLGLPVEFWIRHRDEMG
jgi:hypothetical protein